MRLKWGWQGGEKVEAGLPPKARTSCRERGEAQAVGV